VTLSVTNPVIVTFTFPAAGAEEFCACAFAF
jgi:hypothetical protein